jgi:putative Mg2+ transporter-C (MgtC) family protein
MARPEYVSDTLGCAMSIDEILRSVSQNPEIEALARVLLAGLIGIAVGFERDFEGKPAGARTYGGVALGAATFTTIGVVAFGNNDSSARLAAQIITGIGFLGAGTILHMRLRVVGLTTAAGMWVMAGVGMAIGYGLYILGIGAGIGLFMILQFLEPGRLIARRRGRESNEHDEGPTDEKEAPGL